MGVITIKGIKAIVECYENLYPHYFEKSLTIVFKELFVHFLELCLFTHKVEIL
jgi:hypothetical protein